MKEILTANISKQTSRIALLIFIILCVILYFYRMTTYTFLIVEFNDARPVRNKIPVYYKGYRVGKVEKIKPNKDFTSTMVYIVLYTPHIKLPGNTTALLTREKRDRNEFDFINLIYPEHPSETFLKNGDRLTGFATVDIQDFFSQKAKSRELDIMKNNINGLLTSLTDTAEALTGLFQILQDTVNENRPNIKTTTTNLASMSDNLKLFSKKLNNSINEKQLKNTLSNVDATSGSVVITSKNLEDITKNIDAITGSVNTSMPQVTTSLSTTERIVKNVEEITTGINCTLRQSFGGLRLIFGKPIKMTPCKCIPNCKNTPK